MLFGKTNIGTCSYLGGIMSIPEPFMHAWQQMIEYNNDYLVEQNQKIYYTRATVSYHSFARDTLTESMQGDWILMLDTDIIFEPDLAARMLHKMNKHNIDVLTCMYPYKSYPHPPVMYGYDPKRKTKFILGAWDKNAEIMQIYAAGAGCLMIRKKVIDKIKSKGESPFAIIEPMSEDHSFFERLRKFKIKAYCATDIKIEHLTYRYLSVEKDYPKEDMKIGEKITVRGFK